jgi:phosphoribulokinase
MSVRHPIISITGSSGAGTTSVTRTFENIFRREGVAAAVIEGDSFHRYDRAEMKRAMSEIDPSEKPHFSHFGEEANLFDELETLFRTYSETGTGRSRKYLHNDEEAAPFGQPAGTFTPWADLPPSDLLFYEGLHGGVVTDSIDVSRHVDLLIGVVPVINLEWIQKIHRDRSDARLLDRGGDRTHPAPHARLRALHLPAVRRTHINFQRVPVVDTSEPLHRTRRADRRTSPWW